MNIHDKAVAILQATNDGNDLADWQLGLLQSAVNGKLNEQGVQIFDKLHELIVQNQEYRFTVNKFLKEFFGIEPSFTSPFDEVDELTYDSRGCIYWNNEQVETYSDPEAKDSQASLWELVDQCRHIEALGLVPTMSNTLFCWDWWKTIQPGNAWIGFLTCLRDMHERNKELMIFAKKGEKEFVFVRSNDYADWVIIERQPKANLWDEDEYDYHPISKAGWHSTACQKVTHGSNSYEPDGKCRETLSDVDGVTLINYLDSRKIEPSLFDCI
jgi:hypothetical protein